MKGNLLSILMFLLVSTSFAQLTQPQSYATGEAPVFSSSSPKSLVDSCGAYFNNYIGLTKTSVLFFESMRVGNGITGQDGFLSGRGQRFSAPQPIQVSGVQFYAFQTNPSLDSIRVITLLYDYDEVKDSIGVELARDTVYVKERTFDANLPNREVSSSFAPVTVTNDYIVAIETDTDDSLKIYTNNPGGDGMNEQLAFGLYTNPNSPDFYGWYQSRATYGPAYDIDYLISPKVKFDLHNEYTILNDSICPSITAAACVEYDQLPVYGDPHYNKASASDHIQWLWGDGIQNTMITNACHKYDNVGTYDLTLNDSLERHYFSSPYCASSVTKSIYVLDSTKSNFTTSSAGLTASFVNTTSTFYDSISWNFGDATIAGNTNTTEHVYTSVGSYEVWLYVYGPCNIDSAMNTVVISDLSVGDVEESLFNIFPNPTTNNFTISGDFNNSIIRVFNLLGEELLNTNISGKTIIDCSKWPAGNYLVQLVNEEKEKTVKLVVK